jgi:hypothetical protein
MREVQCAALFLCALQTYRNPQSDADVVEEVGNMKFDPKIITGIIIGMVLGLQYQETLVLYMPLLVIAGLVMLLKVLHR